MVSILLGYSLFNIIGRLDLGKKQSKELFKSIVYLF